MPLDEEVQQLLATEPDIGSAELSYAERRARIRSGFEALYRRTGAPGEALHSVTDLRVPVHNGSIRVRVYRRDAAVRPGHLFLHGGGFWLGSIDDLATDAVCRTRSARAGLVVVAVDYRLAPEHPFPAPFEDCYAALRWMSDHAADLGIDPSNLSVGGVSAGGNLAAAVALATRDRAGPPLRLQLLEVPVLDLTLDTMHASGVGDDYGITIDDMALAARLYLASPDDARHRYASPLLADDLAGVAPARIMTAEFDPLRLDGQAYAERLVAAGAPADATLYRGATHNSMSLTGVWEPARAWREATIAALSDAHHTVTCEVRSRT